MVPEARAENYSDGIRRRDGGRRQRYPTVSWRLGRLGGPAWPRMRGPKVPNARLPAVNYQAAARRRIGRRKGPGLVGDIAAHGAGEGPGDGEAEPYPAHLPLGSLEGLEEALLLARGMPRPASATVKRIVPSGRPLPPATGGRPYFRAFSTRLRTTCSTRLGSATTSACRADRSRSSTPHPGTPFPPRHAPAAPDPSPSAPLGAARSRTRG